jgi:hypothetical protein
MGNKQRDPNPKAVFLGKETKMYTYEISSHICGIAL